MDFGATNLKEELSPNETLMKLPLCKTSFPKYIHALINALLKCRKIFQQCAKKFPILFVHQAIALHEHVFGLC